MPSNDFELTVPDLYANLLKIRDDWFVPSWFNLILYKTSQLNTSCSVQEEHSLLSIVYNGHL